MTGNSVLHLDSDDECHVRGLLSGGMVQAMGYFVDGDANCVLRECCVEYPSCGLGEQRVDSFPELSDIRT